MGSETNRAPRMVGCPMTAGGSKNLTNIVSSYIYDIKQWIRIQGIQIIYIVAPKASI